jgi:hypothetical protein
MYIYSLQEVGSVSVSVSHEPSSDWPPVDWRPVLLFTGDEHGLLAAGPPVGAYRRRTDLLPTIVTPREQRTTTPGRAASLGRIDRLAPPAPRGAPQHVSMFNLAAARSRTRKANPDPASKPNLHGPMAARRPGQRPLATTGGQPIG